jgi:hypothetical protein
MTSLTKNNMKTKISTTEYYVRAEFRFCGPIHLKLQE